MIYINKYFAIYIGIYIKTLKSFGTGLHILGLEKFKKLIREINLYN